MDRNFSDFSLKIIRYVGQQNLLYSEAKGLKRCQGCVQLIASTCKVNCFLNINDLSEVQLCMPSNSWT